MTYALVKLDPLSLISLNSSPKFPPFALPGVGTVMATDDGWQDHGHAIFPAHVEDTAPSPLHRRTGELVFREGGTVRITAQWEPPTLEEAKAAKRAQITAKRDEVMHGGYPANIGGSIHILQTRPEDQVRWTQLHAVCMGLVSSGQAAQLITIRDRDDVDVQVTAAQAVGIISLMFVTGSTVMAIGWNLKNTVEAATTLAEVAAVDVEGAPWV